jgi:hypothetical protein
VRLKTISIENEYGETIEIKQDADGTIKIRHSDINPKRFGIFHEYSKRLRQPEVAEFLKSKGLDPKNPAAAKLSELLGGYIVIDGQSYIINPTETALIHEVIKKQGGIVPNWSSAGT